MTRFATLLFACLLLSSFSPAAARADDSLDAGLAALDEGDFDAAATAFDAALAGDRLSRPELVALLEARAALHFALHDEPALDVDLGWLAALDPGHGFGDNRPPDLARRFVEIEQDHPGALAITATALPSDADVRLAARTERVPEGMRVRVRVCARVERAAWRCVDGGEASSPVSASGVFYYAEALGPGGAVVASAGSASDPLHLAAPAAAPDAAAGHAVDPTGTDDARSSADTGGGHGLAIGLGIGGGVLAVALAVVLALTLGGDGGIHVRTPTVQ